MLATSKAPAAEFDQPREVSAIVLGPHKAHVEPLAEVKSGDCFDRKGPGLDTRVLEDLVEAEQALHRKVSNLLEKIAGDLDATFSAFEEQRAGRVAKERDLVNKQEKLREAEWEIKVAKKPTALENNMKLLCYVAVIAHASSTTLS